MTTTDLTKIGIAAALVEINRRIDESKFSREHFARSGIGFEQAMKSHRDLELAEAEMKGATDVLRKLGILEEVAALAREQEAEQA